MTPEQKATLSIDALLTAVGWHVCNLADADIHVARIAIIDAPAAHFNGSPK